jgi:hypothetical protein
LVDGEADHHHLVASLAEEFADDDTGVARRVSDGIWARRDEFHAVRPRESFPLIGQQDEEVGQMLGREPGACQGVQRGFNVLGLAAHVLVKRQFGQRHREPAAS